MAFIAAYHIANNQKSCSLQVITDDTSWNAEYLFAEFTMEENGVRIGPNVLTRQDCHLDLKREGLEDKGKHLAAPMGGDMKRTIRESAACKTYYHFREKGKTIFEFTSDKAAFEYEYPV